MKLSRAQCFLYPVSYGLTDLRGREFETGTLDHVFLKLTADDGAVGWGEGFGYCAAAATFAALVQIVTPMLEGLDVESPEQTFDYLSRACHQAGLAGPVLYARAAVDIALWDLHARRKACPLHSILGSATGSNLPAYSSLFRYDDADLVAAKCKDRASKGYGAVKLHEVRPEVVAAARRGLGSDPKLMLDANCAWSKSEAISLIQEMCENQLFWVEEPVFPPDDVDALAAVHAATGQRLAAGENAAPALEFSALAEAGQVDILQPSITKIGGVTPMLRLLRECQEHGRQVALHSPYFGPGLLATMHVFVATDQSLMVEYYDADRLSGLPYGDVLAPTNGCIVLPNGNGLGLASQEDVIFASASARRDIFYD